MDPCLFIFVDMAKVTKEFAQRLADSVGKSLRRIKDGAAEFFQYPTGDMPDEDSGVFTSSATPKARSSLATVMTTIKRAGRYLKGLLLFHVDDLLYGGTGAFHNGEMKELRDLVALEDVEIGKFRYGGVLVNTTLKAGYSLDKLPWDQQEKAPEKIELDQEEYVPMLDDINIPDGVEDSQKVPDKTVSDFRSRVGGLNWLNSMTCVVVAFNVSQLAGLVTELTWDGVKKANKVLRQVRGSGFARLVFWPICKLWELRLLVFTDSSWANRKDFKSQGAQVFLLTPDILITKSVQTLPFLMLHWLSRGVKRVTRSTFSSELLSALDGADWGVFISMMINEVLWAGCIEEERSSIPMNLMSDAKSVVDQLANLAPNSTEKRALVDLIALWELLHDKLMRRFIFANANYQLADGLTKEQSNDLILRTLKSGKLEVKECDRAGKKEAKVVFAGRKAATSSAMRRASTNVFRLARMYSLFGLGASKKVQNTSVAGYKASTSLMANAVTVCTNYALSLCVEFPMAQMDIMMTQLYVMKESNPYLMAVGAILFWTGVFIYMAAKLYSVYMACKEFLKCVTRKKPNTGNQQPTAPVYAAYDQEVHAPLRTQAWGAQRVSSAVGPSTPIIYSVKEFLLNLAMQARARTPLAYPSLGHATKPYGSSCEHSLDHIWVSEPIFYCECCSAVVDHSGTVFSHDTEHGCAGHHLRLFKRAVDDPGTNEVTQYCESCGFCSSTKTNIAKAQAEKTTRDSTPRKSFLTANLREVTFVEQHLRLK